MDDVGQLGLDAETPEEQAALASRLIAWADEWDPSQDAGAPPAALLSEAGQILEILGDHVGALAAYRRAASAIGVVDPDVRGFLHRALVSVGDLPEARRLAEEIRRSAPTDLGVYAMVGETYERHGDLDQAHRWLNLGLQRLGGADVDGAGVDGMDRLALDLLSITIVRRRIRRALGLPADPADRVAGHLISQTTPHRHDGGLDQL
jgi:tetratricopeptide (TPR) repeat protein